MMSRFLRTLAAQTVHPAEIVIVDGSDDDRTAAVISEAKQSWTATSVVWRYERADRVGLAPQRNQAVAAASQSFVWFLDDDVILEAECLERLHAVLAVDASIGGATATITNQSYSAPGPWVRALMRWFEDGRVRDSYAAACVGPGWTFLPDASPHMAPVVPAGWLIGCCSMYRRAALPMPAVPEHFEGGAIGEDLAASLAVARTHQLVHVRDARCFHDSQSGDHKRSQRRLAYQGFLNRYHIMTQVMGKRTARDHFDFMLMFVFGLVSLLARPSQWHAALLNASGYAQAVARLAFGGTDSKC